MEKGWTGDGRNESSPTSAKTPSLNVLVYKSDGGGPDI